MNNKIDKHESWGFIRASRVQGHAALFDSAIKHYHYVIVTIGEASQERRLSNSFNYPGRELLQIAMSESQFAQFITSMNVGSGAPCTLQRVMGQPVPPPPADRNTRVTFENEMREKVASLTDKLAEALRHVDDLTAKGKANKGELATLREKVFSAKQDITSNMPFILSQFEEALEKLMDRAKMDINAHAVMVAQATGQVEAPEVKLIES